MNDKDKIIEGYSRIRDKEAVWIAIGEELNILPVSVKNNYFTKLGYIPKGNLRIVLKHINRQLKKERK